MPANVSLPVEGWFETQVRRLDRGSEKVVHSAPAKRFSRNHLKAMLPVYRTDYSQYARDCILVQDEDMRAVPFIFRRAQRKLWEIEAKCIAEGRPFWVEILKIRQHGCSLYMANRNLWKTAFSPNSKALILAHDDNSTANIFNMLKFSWKNLPELMRPLTKNDNRDILFFANPDSKGIEGLESKIHVATAGNVHAGASFTVQNVHISEFGRFDEVTDTKKLMGSLLQSIPFSPLTSIVIESTAHGEGSFKKRWDSNNGFEKIFISYVGVEKYRDMEVDGPFPLSPFEDSEFGNEEADAELIKKEILFWYPEWDEKENSTQIEEEMYRILKWRRNTIRMKCDGDLRLFDQEFPITAERAFMLSGDTVYPNDKMVFIVKGLEKKIEEGKHKPDRYVFDAEASEYKGEHWRMDLLWETNEFGPIHCYEAPQPGFNYAIGIDPSEGVYEGDDQALVVVKIPDLIEVCSWSGKVDPDMVGDMAYILGMCYNKALIGVETQYGQTILSRLRRDLKYPMSRLYRDKKYTSVKEGSDSRFGWHSNEASNKYRRDLVRGLIRDGAFTFNHLPNALEHLRCKRFKDEGKRARYLFIDDKGRKRSPNFTVATGIALQMATIFPTYVNVQEKSTVKNSLQYWQKITEREKAFTGQPFENVNLW